MAGRNHRHASKKKKAPMDALYSELLHIAQSNLTAISGAGALFGCNPDHGRLIAYRKGHDVLCVFFNGSLAPKNCRHSHEFNLAQNFLSLAESDKAKKAGSFDQQFIDHHWAAVAKVVAQWDADARLRSWAPLGAPLADMLAASPAGPLARLWPAHLAAYDRAMAKAIRPRHRRTSFLAQINVDVRAKVMSMTADMEARGVLTYAKFDFPWRDGQRFFRVTSSHFRSGQGAILGASWLDTESGGNYALSLHAFPIPANAFELMVCRAKIALRGRDAFVDEAAARILRELAIADENLRVLRGIEVPSALFADRESAELLDAIPEPPPAAGRRARSL